MRQALIGAVCGAVLMVAAAGLTGQAGEVFGQPAAPSGAGAELIALTTPAGEGRQQLTVIDPKMRVLSVYQIDLATGAVTLKSVRNFHWDLQMVEFNGVSPLPRDIRSLLESR